MRLDRPVEEGSANQGMGTGEYFSDYARGESGSSSVVRSGRSPRALEQQPCQGGSGGAGAE